MNTPHLWEPDHPYYGPETGLQTHKSWADFAATYADADVDMNLVWRWDWCTADDEGQPKAEPYTLRIYMAHQRKARFATHEVTVMRSDEPAVYAFLEKHRQTIQALWAPFTAASGPAADEMRKQLRARRIAEIRAELAELER